MKIIRKVLLEDQFSNMDTDYWRTDPDAVEPGEEWKLNLPEVLQPYLVEAEKRNRNDLIELLSGYSRFVRLDSSNKISEYAIKAIMTYLFKNPKVNANAFKSLQLLVLKNNEIDYFINLHEILTTSKCRNYDVPQQKDEFFFKDRSMNTIVPLGLDKALDPDYVANPDDTTLWGKVELLQRESEKFGNVENNQNDTRNMSDTNKQHFRDTLVNKLKQKGLDTTKASEFIITLLDTYDLIAKD